MNLSSKAEIINDLSNSAQITFEDSFNLSKKCASMLRDSELENDARDIIIRVQDAWNKIPENTRQVWNDLTEASGLYPYVNPDNLSASSLLRYEYHRSSYLESVVLHEEQQHLAMALLSKKSVVVSAPTSFGKSLLIEEVISSKIYKNIVIIQPTLALLDETRKKLHSYHKDYKIVVSTNQIPDENIGNIFLFTGERVVEYKNFPKIDFFVIDEFYKLSLSRDDDRAITLNQAFQKQLRSTTHFYLLGPMIKQIPVSFSSKFDFLWYPTDFATVAVDEKSMEVKESLKRKEKSEKKKSRLFELLLESPEPTLIYCSSPGRATQLTIEFQLYLEQNDFQNNNLKANGNDQIIEWIEESINRNWSLIDALKFKIAFHHGALPRHLGSSIVDLFNSGDIHWLFCTATLIEGVNTSAKNVILFDKEKGGKKIDFFDYKNIAGRSGRMNQHFIGNVYRFEEQPEQMEMFVDIPIFDQEEAPLEILISLNEDELQEKGKERLKEFDAFPQEIKELLKLNPSIDINGQLKLIETLEANPERYNQLLNWKTFPPNFDSLSIIIELFWEFIAKENDKKMFINRIGRLSARWLASFAFSYINNKSLQAVIRTYINDGFWIEKIPDQRERINTVTFTILQITRHWFDYKLPKWLAVMSDIQDYVFRKRNLPQGDYTFLASNLEHGFLAPNLAALMEYDIPSSAIRKLSPILNSGRAPEVLIQFVVGMTDEELKKRGLIDYEINKVRKAL